jgi:hypothetical protein
VGVVASGHHFQGPGLEKGEVAVDLGGCHPL